MAAARAGSGAELRHHGARRARGLPQARPRSPRAAAQPGRGREEPAASVDRVLGADESRRRDPTGRVHRLRGSMERQLRRGPHAQRLAARARQAPRLEQPGGGVPALPHERRPRGHLLLARHRAAGGPRRERGGDGRVAGPEGCGRRLRDPGGHVAGDEGPEQRRHLEEGAPQRRHRQAARGAAGGGADLRRRCRCGRRGARIPGALPRQEGVGGDPQRRRARDPGTDAHGPERQRRRGRAVVGPLGALPACGSRLLDLVEHRPADGHEAAAQRRRPLPARRAIAHPHRPRARPARRDAGLEGARRPACRQRQGPVAAGDPGHQRDGRDGAEGSRVDVLEGAGPEGHRRGLAGQPVAARHQPRASGRAGRPAELLRRPRGRRPRPAAGAAAARRAGHAGGEGCGADEPGPGARPGARLDRPARRRCPRMELFDPRHGRSRAARGGAVRLRARNLGSLHQHQRPDQDRGGDWSSASRRRC